jgi:hypothetical protein
MREYHDKVEHIHLNRVKAGLVKRPEHWKWSSMAEYAGLTGEEQEHRWGSRIHRVPQPIDLKART